MIPVYEKLYGLYDNNPYYLLHAALAADEAGKETVRDTLLKRIVKDLESSDNEFNKCYGKLSEWIIADLAAGSKGESDLKEIDSYMNSLCSDHRANLPYFIGKYLQLRGKPEKAKDYYRRSFATIQVAYWNRTLAGAELIALGEPRDCYLSVLDDEIKNEKLWQQKRVEKAKEEYKKKVAKEKTDLTET